MLEVFQKFRNFFKETAINIGDFEALPELKNYLTQKVNLSNKTGHFALLSEFFEKLDAISPEELIKFRLEDGSIDINKIEPNHERLGFIREFYEYCQKPLIGDEIDFNKLSKEHTEGYESINYTHIMLAHIVTLKDPLPYIVTIKEPLKRKLGFQMLLAMHRGMLPSVPEEKDQTALFDKESPATDTLPALVPYAIPLLAGREDVTEWLKGNKFKTKLLFRLLVESGQSIDAKYNNRLAIETYLTYQHFTHAQKNTIIDKILTYEGDLGKRKPKTQILVEENPETARLICDHITAPYNNQTAAHFLDIFNRLCITNPEMAAQFVNKAKEVCKHIITQTQAYETLLPHFFKTLKLIHSTEVSAVKGLIEKLKEENSRYIVDKTENIYDILFGNEKKPLMIGFHIDNDAYCRRFFIVMEAVKHSNNITELYLKSLVEPKYKSPCISILCNALTENKSVTKLDLDNKQLEDKEIEAVANLIKNNSSIKTLDISHNRITDEGARILGQALKFNNSIQTLNIQFNRITDEGAKILAEVLKFNSSIKILNIKCDKITETGMDDIANGILANSDRKEGIKVIGLGKAKQLELDRAIKSRSQQLGL